MAGADLTPRTAIILGVVNLLADGFSMGASNFLSIRSAEAVLATRNAAAEEPFPARHATAPFSAFVLAGSVPLIPYALTTSDRFAAATIVTLALLFAVGALRSAVTALRWWRAGAEMLLLGGLAAAVSFGVGAFLATLT